MAINGILSYSLPICCFASLSEAVEKALWRALPSAHFCLPGMHCVHMTCAHDMHMTCT